jgi:uncharacterized protein (TIGR03086 family)
MSSNLRHYLAAITSLEHAIRNVPTDGWDKPSPCEGWSVKDVAGHAMAVANNISKTLGHSDSLDPFIDHPGDHCGNDPWAKWLEIRTNVLFGLDQPDALQHEMQMGPNTLVVDQVLAFYTCDALIHSWDIARGSGGDERLDPGLVTFAQSTYDARDAAGTLRVGNRYQPAGTTSHTDAQSRLLAFVGRTP